ncbi:peptidyl-prolyl cis-trans isomerase, cyclophilin type [Magnetococcus marinus MC-1]|uniref:Peptidyl-prolyl cis-trans isomerase n=1 Tax=Magnetococcus marinus (strain ATCC BAA-1437 / JCM 17883 / MC-1) TaxID=156889 RepID=A0L4I2_MAGMM|nr:peptidylprolyl isomerase [Magnetococcus marinus]ABK42875.1 peptidyl-prolyl cis-trans isomerase, cyclophilin type [Magnetococcus marinus MC-1]
MFFTRFFQPSAWWMTLGLLLVVTSPTMAGAQGKGANPVIVKLSTSMGDIKLQLDAEKAPISTENFLSYVKKGHYDGTIFHRVIPGFMVQGGGMDANMKEKSTDAPIKNEADNGLVNKRGSVAMARTQVVDSATSQFFINVNNNDFLNHGGRDFGYAVFGEVIEGMDVVDQITAQPTGNKGYHQDVPTTPITINSATQE